RVDGRAINGELKNLGAWPEVENYADVAAFKRAYETERPGIEWYREHLDLPRYYAYRSIVEAIHHYDIGNGKNYYYYHNPETNQWATLPWDLDLTWGDNMFGPGTEPFVTRALAIDELDIEYQNHQRHVLNLLYNPEQTGMLIDEKAAIVYTPGEPSLVDADRAMWDHNPIMSSNKVNSSKSSPGLFYRKAATRDFPGMIKVLKDYIVHRSDWIERTILNDSRSPKAPSVTYTGPEGFPVDGLRFETTAFNGGTIFAPQTFAALQWRIAEVSDPAAEDFTPAGRHAYEIEADWQSDEITTFESTVTIPVNAVQPGKRYRVRARMKNASGYFGDWSDPVQFTAGETDITPYEENLIITELFYEPAPETAEERALGYEASDFEFIELWNAGSTALDLAPVRFTKGIDFDFAAGAIAVLEPGAYVVVVRNEVAFKSRYGDGLPIAGEYSGRLSNGGERIKLSFGGGLAIRDFEYDNREPWPTGAAEGGVSLVLAGAAQNPDVTDPSVWRASAITGGTPGEEELIEGGPSTMTWAVWQAASFSEAELAEPSISGPLVDPDGDG
ncbi:MAG: CotH kinase family protein, partial [Verrucomicrobiota bacterium]